MCDKKTLACILGLIFVFGSIGQSSCAVIHVKWDSAFNGPGYDWEHAYQSVAAGIEAAVSGDEVWVAGNAEHPYEERVILKLGVALYGGFNGKETSRSLRDWQINKTIIDGKNAGTVVICPVGATSSTLIDGFRIQNGKNSSAGNGSGIYCFSSSPTISNNIITSNDASYGGGIYCSASSPTITNNAIIGNNAAEGGGIYLTNYSSPATANNTITHNTSACYGGGIYCFASSPVVSNNIVAFNSSGIFQSCGSPVLQSNDFYENVCANYDGINPGVDDISVNPKLEGDYHLQSISFCIDKGSNKVASNCDIDGQTRINGQFVDIGADEYWPTIMDAKKSSGNETIGVSGSVITASLKDSYYIESPDRTMGIKVEKVTQDIELPVGTKVDVIGKTLTDENGEQYISLPYINQIGKGNITPLAMNNCGIGGGPLGNQAGVYGWLLKKDEAGKTYRVWGPVTGLNSIGLLIKTWGKVNEIEQVTPPALPTWFKIDDGSDLQVKCILPEGVTIDPESAYVSVIGVASCEKVGDELYRIVRVRTQADIESTQNAD